MTRDAVLRSSTGSRNLFLQSSFAGIVPPVVKRRIGIVERSILIVVIYFVKLAVLIQSPMGASLPTTRLLLLQTHRNQSQAVQSRMRVKLSVYS